MVLLFLFGLVRKYNEKPGMSAEVDKLAAGEKEEEEEEFDCSVPEVVNKYQFAGKVANGKPMWQN
eukprot:356805-Rhodomonas_salina.2